MHGYSISFGANILHQRLRLNAVPFKVEHPLSRKCLEVSHATPRNESIVQNRGHSVNRYGYGLL